MQSDPIESCEYTAQPADYRCRFWAKIVRVDCALPLPCNVSGANDVPGNYLPKGGSEEVFPGDFVLTGEENHHRKQRGWTYELHCYEAGELVSVPFGTAGEAKPWLRQQGRKDLLTGAGQIAAMIREIHVARLRGTR